MNLSFYNGAVGAAQQQERLNVIANNIANVNTEGYKAKNAVFTNLIQMNLNEGEQTQTRLRAGAAVKLDKTDTDMRSGALKQTDDLNDFAIIGEGFFALRNPADYSVSYTRNGSFIASQRADGAFYLSSSEGHLVLGKDQQPIRLFGGAEEEPTWDAEDEESLTNLPLTERIGVFRFDHYNNMQSVGSGRFLPTEKNGYPVLSEDTPLVQGMLESSNVDFAQEMARMIETQRAYQYALKMVTTSDEVEGIINSLRG